MIKHREYLLLTVPEGITKPHTVNRSFLVGHTRTGEKGSFWKQHDIKLPPGSWQLIGRASELTEEQKKEIVERLYHNPDYPNMDVWRNYTPSDYHCSKVSESFASLLRSHNLKPDTTIVLKQIQP